MGIPLGKTRMVQLELRVQEIRGENLDNTWYEFILECELIFLNLKELVKIVVHKNSDVYILASTVPVVIVMKISGKAKANVGISGTIGFDVNSNFNLNTTVKFTYKNGN